MDKAERKKVAAEIAAALGETGDRPRRQIERIVERMGAEWTRQRLTESLFAAESPATRVNSKPDGGARTAGGVFFATARVVASADVKTGTLTRREFFRCFFDRPRAARAPKPAPKAKPARRDETRAPQAQVKPKRQATVPEVYVTRRRS